MKSSKKSIVYKAANDREKDLNLALSRIQHGRAKTGESKVSIAAVAREAGVSAALIHNHYPEVAEAIRKSQNRSSRAVRDMKHDDLINERKKSVAYRQQIVELREKVARLASINEVLSDENNIHREKLVDRRVVALANHKS
jgi:AcrR family transcriptional regulator